MKGIERFTLIDKVARALQARMTYGDIDSYLSGFGVTIKATQPSYNSKWARQ